LIVTNKGRLLLWQSSLKGIISPDAGGCFYTSSRGEAQTSLSFFLLSDLSSIQRVHTSDYNASSTCSKLRLTFSSYPNQEYLDCHPLAVYLPSFMSFNKPSSFLLDVWYFLLSLNPFSYLLVNPGILMDVESCHTDLKTKVNGATDLLHDGKEVINDLVKLEQVLLWGKHGKDTILSTPSPSPPFAVRDSDAPLVEKMGAKMEQYKINLNTSLFPLCEGEEIVDAVATKASVSWSDIRCFTFMILAVMVNILEIIFLTPLDGIFYPLVLLSIFNSQPSVKRYMTSPLLAW
jgi:hypothetical protein